MYFYFENEEYINVPLNNNNNNNVTEDKSGVLPSEHTNIKSTLNNNIPEPSHTNNNDPNLREMKKSPTETIIKPIPNARISDISVVAAVQRRNKSKTVIIKKVDTSRIDTIEMNNLKAYCLQTKVIKL